MYDYLIVGAGLFGSVCARELTNRGKKVLVVEKRNHIGGNCYTENVEGINVHKYGAHIFHTSDETVWEYVNRFVEFNDFVNSPLANFEGEIYNLPFNMNTFKQFWGVATADEARAEIERQVKAANILNPKNLEEQAISLVGTDIYEKLIKGYTEKQWGKACKDLPPEIIKRIPLRFTFDNNYFNDKYQGIPVGGYTRLFEGLLDRVEVKLNCDFILNKDELEGSAEKIIYTGMIDEYFGFSLGELEYRSLQFETKILNKEDYQKNAVINYTSVDIPYTRIIEHKHFEFGKQKNTVVTYEYPKAFKEGDEPYYPINNEKNNSLYNEYLKLKGNNKKLIFGGRLGLYSYLDMDKTIARALEAVKDEL